MNKFEDESKLESEIGYTFNDKMILFRALSHSSYANEAKDSIGSNERLEFLGDAVLSIVVSDSIFKDYTHLPEGELTRIRASLVCEQALFGFAKEIHLGHYIKLGKGERLTGGNERPSILSDAFEALIAAIYLDGGISAASKFVMRFVSRELAEHHGGTFDDYKTKLQEIIQQNPEEHHEYRLCSESGPDHDKRFTVEVLLNTNVIGKGTAHTKKQAEQFAAKEALGLMGE